MLEVVNDNNNNNNNGMQYLAAIDPSGDPSMEGMSDRPLVGPEEDDNDANILTAPKLCVDQSGPLNHWTHRREVVSQLNLFNPSSSTGQALENTGGIQLDSPPVYSLHSSGSLPLYQIRTLLSLVIPPRVLQKLSLLVSGTKMHK